MPRHLSQICALIGTICPSARKFVGAPKSAEKPEERSDEAAIAASY